MVNLDAYWMPYTANREFKKSPRLIKGAEGRYYIDEDNRRIFDGLSGLWTTGLGHNHPHIVKAIQEQAATLDYVPAFQHGHTKAFEFAERLVEFMPNQVTGGHKDNKLSRVFFTNSGSDACDTAMKFARAYWVKQGQATKTRFIGRQRGYHGVNFGGISVGGIAPNRHLFGQTIESAHLKHTLLPENLFAKGCPEIGAHLADQLLDHIALYDASTIAAVIVEPMAGSTGVIPPPKGYLKRLREICTAHNILLIFDEVITGFGRIGANTAAEHFDVIPDMMTLAKQISNGAVPIGAVVASEHIYDTFMQHGGPEYMLEMAHGYTYSGHPLACAAGLATLDIIEKENIMQQVSAISPYFEEIIHQLKGNEHILDIRNYGLAAGLTIRPLDGEPAKLPAIIARKLWDKGFYVRYGGDTIQMGLPFGTTESEVDSLVNALGDSINYMMS